MNIDIENMTQEELESLCQKIQNHLNVLVQEEKKELWEALIVAYEKWEEKFGSIEDVGGDYTLVLRREDIGRYFEG